MTERDDEGKKRDQKKLSMNVLLYLKNTEEF